MEGFLQAQQMPFYSQSPEQTQRFAKDLGQAFLQILQTRSYIVLALEGDLAAGKTQLVRGILLGLGAEDASACSSPTFNYLNEYRTQGSPLFHFDCYRINDEEEFLKMGFEDYLYQRAAVSCVEWPSRIASLLPEDTLWLDCAHGKGDNERVYTLRF